MHVLEFATVVAGSQDLPPAMQDTFWYHYTRGMDEWERFCFGMRATQVRAIMREESERVQKAAAQRARDAR